METFEAICAELAALHAKKNAAYGNSFEKTFETFGLVSAAVRLADKTNRLATLAEKPEIDVGDESVEDTLKDLAAYAIMTLAILRERKGADARY